MDLGRFKKLHILVLAALFAQRSHASLRGSPAEDSTNGVAPRIINGLNVEPYRYPYYVMMIGSGMCGGVLIAPDLVLSAAHCSRISATVRIGIHDRTRMYEADRIVIEQTFVHPEYRTGSFRYDAMILKLREKSVRPYAQINPNVIVPRPLNALGPPDELTVIGFGDADPGRGTRIPLVLQETQLDYVSNDECNTNHGPNLLIQEDTLCAYRDDTDSCYGDSGGPIIMKGADETEDVVVGTVSWGRDCAMRGFPGVYARTSYFYDWIVQTACAHSEEHPFDCSPYAPSASPSRAPTSQPTREQGKAYFVGWEVATNGPLLGHCEGDCDNDEECDGDLVCYQRSGQFVPGCEGRRQHSIADYCIKEEDVTTRPGGGRGPP